LNLKERAVSLAADHIRMCQFSNVGDHNWLIVGAQLQRYYQESVALEVLPLHTVLDPAVQGTSLSTQSQSQSLNLLKDKLQHF
jgi:hypothetical protein